MPSEDLAALLLSAERQLKLSFAISTTMSSSPRDKQLFEYLDVFSFGNHTYTHAILSLTRDEEELAAASLEHTSTYVLAAQMDAVLESVVPNRFLHPDQVLVASAWISRLVRNAFAHNPLNPVWKLDRRCRNREFSVPGAIDLNTTSLHGHPVRRTDYGGPLALLALSTHVREHVLTRTITPDS